MSQESPKTGRGLAPPPAADATPIVPREVQELWLPIVRQRWSSLALVPAQPGLSGIRLASALTVMAPLYGLGAFRVVSAEGASLSEGARLARGLADEAKGVRAVVLVDCPLESAGAMPLVTAVDAVIVLVRFGESRVAAAERIVRLLGRERVLGAVEV